VLRIVEEQGSEPRSEENAIVLGTCPFHTLAQRHTDLVSKMNLCLLKELLAGLGTTQLQARLKPEPGQCCARLESTPT
jgi:predicted ArsR family transcriptional regulator